jgi:flagellin-like protein
MTISSLFFGLRRKMNRKRSGVSPIIATTILIAITITVGLALWGFANSGVGNATVKYSQAVDSYGEFVGDRFVIANVDFDNPSDGVVAFWVFNSGKLPTTISHAVLTCRDCGGNVPQVDLAGPVIVAPKDLGKITLDLRPTITKIDGTANYGAKTYEITVLSDSGATQHFVIKSD